MIYSAELSFPFSVDSTGAIASVSDPHEVARQHLITFVSTGLGQRVMRGDWGVASLQAMFASMDTTLKSQLLQEIDTQVTRQCPEVNLTHLDLTEDVSSGTVSVVIEYSVGTGPAASVSVSLTTPTSQ